jgi:putative SOS response-associated peptidase YedK
MQAHDTTVFDELMESLHNRMPVMLKRGDYARWLAPAETTHLPTDLLRPFPA